MARWQDIVNVAANHTPRSLVQGRAASSDEMIRLQPQEAHPYHEICIGVTGQSAVAGPDTYVPVATGHSCIVFRDALHWESAIAWTAGVF